jgi:glycosyltransferase involved in cell wall biosynthesis
VEVYADPPDEDLHTCSYLETGADPDTEAKANTEAEAEAEVNARTDTETNSLNGASSADPPIVYRDKQTSDSGGDAEASNNKNDDATATNGPGRVCWYHYAELDLNRQTDVFIAWRYALSLFLGHNARQRFLWLHDLVPADSLPNAVELSMHVDAVFVQSDFHKRRFLTSTSTATSTENVEVKEEKEDKEHVVDHKSDRESTSDNIDPQQHLHPLAEKVIILPNGVVDVEHCEGPNHGHVFVYGSSPDRGLDYILAVWPLIRQRIPTAELHVYYGFTDAVKRHLTIQLGPEGFERYYRDVMIKLETLPGVRYHGSVDHTTLKEAYSHAGFLLYPTAFPETGCITAMKVSSKAINKYCLHRSLSYHIISSLLR